MGMSEQNQPEKKKNFQHHMAVPGKKGIIYTIARGIFWIYFHLFCFMHCTGREKLNLDAPYIVIANHTSFADPIIAAMLIRRYEVLPGENRAGESARGRKTADAPAHDSR